MIYKTPLDDDCLESYETFMSIFGEALIQHKNVGSLCSMWEFTNSQTEFSTGLNDYLIKTTDYDIIKGYINRSCEEGYLGIYDMPDTDVENYLIHATYVKLVFLEPYTLKNRIKRKRT